MTIDGELIETTAEHPFYTDEGEWVNAADLSVGELIWSFDGDYGAVETVILVEDVYQPMYNLTVTEAHTFYVGEGDWLVHNQDDTSDNRPRPPRTIDFSERYPEFPAPPPPPPMFVVESYSEWGRMLERDRNQSQRTYQNWQGHHVVNRRWLSENYIGYDPMADPVIAMPNNPNHNATRGVYNTWAAEIKGKYGWTEMRWNQVSESDIQDLTNRMNEAANIPDEVRNEWQTLHNEYISTSCRRR